MGVVSMAKRKAVGEPNTEEDEELVSEEDEEEDDDDDGEIRCVCGKDVDKGLMIQCEKCLVWQHGLCMDIKTEEEVPDNWFCELCQRQLEMSRPSFSFLNDNDLISQFDADYRILEQNARKHPQETIRSLDTDIGLDLLEKYALKFGRNKTTPGTDQIYIRAVSLLLKCTEEHIGEQFSRIAEEIESLVPSEETGDGGTGPYDGWRKEITNVYPKAGAKRPPNCQDANCSCFPFRNAKYASLNVQKRNSEYSLFSDAPIKSGTLIIEFIGEVLDPAVVKKTKREESGNLFDHDIPYVLFTKTGDGKETCVDARKRGNIARFIRYSCKPNAKAVPITAHGRTYLGIYATQDIPTGHIITIPFRFPGKNFKSTVQCFCQDDECLVKKWYKHRGSQVVRRLKVAITLLSDGDIDTTLAAITSPIRRSQSRLEQQKREFMRSQPGSQTASQRLRRNSKELQAPEKGPGRRKTKVVPASSVQTAGKTGISRNKSKKESRASQRAETLVKKEPGTPGRKPKVKREETPVQVNQEKNMKRVKKTSKRSKKRRGDSITPAYTQLILDIDLLRKALKVPVRYASLAVGKKRAIQIKMNEKDRYKQLLQLSEHPLRLPRKKSFVSKPKGLTNSLPSVPALPAPSTGAPVPNVPATVPEVTPHVKSPPLKPSPPVEIVTQQPVPSPPKEEELVTQTPPPSPPSIPRISPYDPIGHGKYEPIGRFAQPISTAGYNQQSSDEFPRLPNPRGFAVPSDRPPQSVTEKEKSTTILGLQRSRSLWDVSDRNVVERKPFVSPPRDRPVPRQPPPPHGRNHTHVPLRRSEMTVHSSYQRNEPNEQSHEGDNMDIDEEGVDTNNILYVNRSGPTRHGGIPPGNGPSAPQDHRRDSGVHHGYPMPQHGYPQRQTIPHHALHTPSSRNWGPPRGPPATRGDYYRRPYDMPKYKRR